jgi:predicted nucleic acid-binding protein
MFLLDTNVLSALMYPTPPAAVMQWVSARSYDELFTASVCQAEILAGLAVMPHGRRRQRLEQQAEMMFANDFSGQVLPFDTEATASYASILVARRRLGRPISTEDLMIAAVALSRNLSIVTRNIDDFDHCGVEVIDPWDDE